MQVLVKDLLRKYPQWSHDCIAVVGNISSKNVQEPKAKAALIWMLGEYAEEMQDAPYVLESLIENWDDEHSAEVRRKCTSPCDLIFCFSICTLYESVELPINCFFSFLFFAHFSK